MPDVNGHLVLSILTAVVAGVTANAIWHHRETLLAALCSTLPVPAGLLIGIAFVMGWLAALAD